MRRIGRHGMIAAVFAVGALALSGCSDSENQGAPPQDTSTAPSAPASTPDGPPVDKTQCTRDDVNGSLIPGTTKGSEFSTAVVIRNNGDAECSVKGATEVLFETADHTELDVDQIPDTTTPETKLLLKVGEHARLALRYPTGKGEDCTEAPRTVTMQFPGDETPIGATMTDDSDLPPICGKVHVEAWAADPGQ